LKVAYPTPQQEAEVHDKAKLFSAAYAQFESQLELKPPSEFYPLLLKQLFTFLALPKANEFDWRDQIDIPKAQHQGTCYSCSSFAISAATEIQSRIKYASSAITVTAQHMHTCITHQRETDTKMICNGGIAPERLLKLLKEHPYAIGGGTSIFPSNACAVTACRPQ